MQHVQIPCVFSFRLSLGSNGLPFVAIARAASVTGPWVFAASGLCLHSARCRLVFVSVEEAAEFSEGCGVLGHKPPGLQLTFRTM